MKSSAFIAKPHLTVFLLSIFLTACSSNPEKKEQLTEKQYYQDAQAAMDSNRFLSAIEKLQSLESRYPFGRYADQAQLELVYCYYRTLDFESAGVTAERFIRHHPDHNNLDYVYYMKGLAAYSVDRGLVERFIPTDFSERDMGPARESFDDFNRLIVQFPDSEYAEDSRQRMIYLRNLLAAYELKSAQFYMKRKAFVAAAKRATFVIENYDRTPSLPEALVILTKSYLELGLMELATTAEQTLAYNFPQHKALSSEGKINYTPRSQKRTSLLSTVSFGFFE